MDNSTARTVKPFFLDVDSNDRAYLHSALDHILDSGTLILGKQTSEFEQKFSEFIGTEHAVSMNSATSVLEVQLRLENVEGRKVAVPTNTNFATVAAIIHAGGRPVFMDMNASTFMPGQEQVRDVFNRHPDLAGIVLVHIGGTISPDIGEIAAVAAGHGLFLIEDCAHAHGSVYLGRSAGTFGETGAFSFFPTKVMTTMEGGMFVTNNANKAALARSYRNQGKRDGNYNVQHVDMGNSWRLSEFAAAWGIMQLRKLEDMLAARSRVGNIYESAYRNIGLQYVSNAHMDRASYYKSIAIMPDGVDLDGVKRKLAANGVVVGGATYDVPCHLQPVFEPWRDASADLSVAEQLCSRQLCLPITSGMVREDAEYVVELLATAL